MGERGRWGEMQKREPKMENLIQHFSHEHPLRLEKNEISQACWICSQDISSPMYVCSKEYCFEGFSIHKSCTELPREMVHPFHRQHSLILFVRPPLVPVFAKCSACGTIPNAPDYYYHCSDCQFDLHISCASLMPAKSKVQERQIQHLGHPHPLILCNNNTIFNFTCSGCKLPFNESWIYVCLYCNCLLDDSCAKWPSQIEHPFHPQHPLTLFIRTTLSWCRACGRLPEGFSFDCSDCKFSLDACCASLMPAQNFQGRDKFQIQQLSHPHPVIPCEKKKGFRLSCSACQLHFENSSVYICLECNLLLHKSCADLPREVKHSFYHQHTLTLLEYTKEFYWKGRHHLYYPTIKVGYQESSGQFRCHACYRYASGFAYVCHKCAIIFDTRCPISKPRLIKSELHQHPLAFFTDKSYNINCHACLSSLQTPFFRCVDCNFNLHVKCVPALPPTAKDKHHRHPLTLTNSPIKDRPDEDENAEFYCDACEESRELYEPTYYCEECHYVAHVHCLVYEILPILEEEWSLACKLGNTKSDISTIGCEDNTATRVSKVLTIEEIMEEEGVEQEYHVGADEVDMASKSSRKVFSDVSTDNEIMERGVPSAIASKTGRARVASDYSLIELDEEIVVLRSEVEWLARKLKATERRLKELEERPAQHVASPLPISRDGLNVE